MTALLDLLLSRENARLAAETQMAQTRAELELKKLQIEVENAEILQSVEAKRRDHEEQIREARRVLMANAREKKRAAKQGQQMQPTTGANIPCRVCQDPTLIDLTPEEILWHKAGHTPTQSAFPLH